MVSSYSFHKLKYAYDDHCILDANVTFVLSPPVEPTTSSSSAYAFASVTSELTELSDEPEIEPQPFAVLIRKYPDLQENEKNFLATRE